MILGISPDSPKTQAGFRRKHNLPFTLLCDPDKAVANSYGVVKDKSLYGKLMKGIERTTFLIGADGAIRRIFRKVKADGHAREVLAAL